MNSVIVQPPQDVAVEQMNGQIRLSWKSSTVKEYRIRLFAGSLTDHILTVSGSETDYFLSLNPCIAYVIELCAVDDQDRLSIPVFKTVVPKANAPPPPENLQVVDDLFIHAHIVTWDYPTDFEPNCELVFHFKYTYDTVEQVISSFVGNSIDVSGLPINTLVTYHVRAYYRQYGSEKSAPVTVSRLTRSRADLVPSKPDDVQVEASCGSLKIRWTSNNADKYVLYHLVRTVELGTGATITTKATGTTTEVRGLKCDHGYVVTISSVNDCGSSDESEPIYVVAADQVNLKEISHSVLHGGDPDIAGRLISTGDVNVTA
ncbi:unnamed protein product [Echinostoma caproni]|uniref:Fibronectin type III domain protein n=1 Tax=Echinostoma caproni TaxID=27848 RepID=A0A183AGU4_9TREM|nr:unnamed protein product [Echinostoma caproni]